MLGVILNHPAVKKARAAGEERFGKAVTHLLASERLNHRLQSLMETALQAKATLESGLRRALHAVNVPSTDELEELKRKLNDLELLVEKLSSGTCTPKSSSAEKH